MRAPKASGVGLAFLALGVVFGDIGTSPLYAFETALTAGGGTPEAAFGVASLIFWALLLVVTIKYGALVLKSDFRGEGGIFALLALLKTTPFLSKRPGVVLGVLIIFGAALLFGDGAITPAISVLSALEGLQAVHPDLGPLVLPGAVLILAVLFWAQRFGTGGLGRLFSPVMGLWFFSIAVLGGHQILQEPEVLKAFNPAFGWSLLAQSPGFGMAVIGAVVLAITGAEALYADLGHFGRVPIVRAWRWVVFPALILNYFGQAAFVVRHPDLAGDSNLFFLLAPTGGMREAMVILATLATIIASQALISGVFSLTSQAIDLGYLPRFFVRHTNATVHGQIYIPAVNFLLGAVCLMLVLGFRSSGALANAYGIAVTGAMIITSLAYVAVFVAVKRRAMWKGALLLVALLLLDLPLFISTISKLLEGGVFPVLIACFLAVVMLTWRKGRDLVRRSMSIGGVTAEQLSERLVAGEFLRTPVTQVFVVPKPEPERAVAEILEQNRRLRAVAENIVILLLNPGWDNPREASGPVSVQTLPGKLWIVKADYGYMRQPDVPEIMKRAIASGIPELETSMDDLFYLASRDLVVASSAGLMPSWQRSLYSFLNRNVLLGPKHLNVPPEKFVIFFWMLRV